MPASGCPRPVSLEGAARLEAEARLLSDPTIFVRVDAIRAIAATADADDRLRQRAADIFCAYLRTRPLSWKPRAMTMDLEESEVRNLIVGALRCRLLPTSPASWVGVRLDFRGAIFGEHSFFAGAILVGTNLFRDARFAGNATFRFASFVNGADGGVGPARGRLFAGVRVNGALDLDGATIDGNLSLHRALVRGPVNLSLASIRGSVEVVDACVRWLLLVGSTCGGDITVRATRVLRDIDLGGLRAYGVVELDRVTALWGRVNFEGARLRTLVIRETGIGKGLKVTSARVRTFDMSHTAVVGRLALDGSNVMRGLWSVTTLEGLSIDGTTLGMGDRETAPGWELVLDRVEVMGMPEGVLSSGSALPTGEVQCRCGAVEWSRNASCDHDPGTTSGWVGSAS